MSYVIITLRILLLAASMYGYIRLLCDKIRPEFTPAVLFAGVGSVIFLSGILNLMREAAVLIVLGGLFLTVRSIVKKKTPRPLVCPAFFYYAAAGAMFFVFLYGVKFTNYDSFSHWGVALKSMLQKNRLPNFEDTYISFQSYPTGSACAVWFFEKIAGLRSEWSQCWVHTMIQVGMLTALFAFVKGALGNITVGASLLILFTSIANAQNTLNGLLVDNLLAVTGLSATLIALYYREEIREKLWAFPLFSVFLIAIKNSGIFFILPLLFLLWLFTDERKKHWKSLAVQCAFPVGALILWQAHVRLVFQNGMNTRHSLSLRQMGGIFLSKDIATIKLIAVNFLRTVFSYRNPALYFFVFAAIFTVIFWKKKPAGKRYPRPIFFLLAVYMAYQIGTFGMYLLSMPTPEAIILQCYDRYHLTVLTYLTGTMLAGVLPYIVREAFGNTIAARLKNVLLAAAIIASVHCGLMPDYRAFYRRPVNESDYESVGRAEFDRLVEEGVPSGLRYLVVTDANGYFYDYLTKFFFFAENDKVLGEYTAPPSDKEKQTVILECWRDYDYILLVRLNDDMRGWFEEVFGTSDSAIRVKDVILPSGSPAAAR